MKACMILDSSSTYPISEVCEVFDIPVSSYYARKSRPLSARAKANIELTKDIAVYFAESGNTYGSPRIAADFAEAERPVCRHRIARLMKKKGLDAKPKASYKPQGTDSNHSLGYAPNLVQRDFASAQPNEVWVGDVTYIQTDEGFAYLCVFIDLFARKVVGVAAATHKRDELSCAALKQAMILRQPSKHFIVHTDRGGEFASKEFRNILKENSAMQSMSRKANCYDNAVAESFFASLEKDIILRNHFQTKQQAINVCTNYVLNFYNPKRRHSSNGQKSPNQAEALFACSKEGLAA